MLKILTDLQHYIPCDSREIEPKEKIIDFIQKNDDPFVRSNLSGHVTGSGLLMSCDGTKILMNHHAKLNMWMGFGGHCDGDSNVWNVGKRETIEESGIQNIRQIEGIFDVDIHPIPANINKNEPEHFHYDICYLFQCEDNESPKISDESHDVKWCDYDEALHLDIDERTKRLLDKWQTWITK